MPVVLNDFERSLFNLYRRISISKVLNLYFQNKNLYKRSSMPTLASRHVNAFLSKVCREFNSTGNHKAIGFAECAQ